MKRLKHLSLFALSLALASGSSVFAEEPDTKNSQTSEQQETQTQHLVTSEPIVIRSPKQKKPEPNKDALRRLDFRLEGSGCASCLQRVRKRMDALKNVVTAAVAVQPPYGVSVIYDGSKLDKDQIMAAALKDEKVKVKIVDVSDKPVDTNPDILVPRHNYFPALESQ